MFMERRNLIATLTEKGGSQDAESKRKIAYRTLRVIARHGRAVIRGNEPVLRPRPLQGRLGGRQYVQCGRLCQVQRRDLHLYSNPHGICRRRLESGLDAVAVEYWRLVYRRHDAPSPSPFSHADTDADSTSHTDAHARTDTESRPGMQRDSDLDRDRDLHGRPARELERLH